MSNNIIDGFYLKSKLNIQGWNPDQCQVSEPQKITKKGKLEGRTFCVYTKTINHKGGWKFKNGLAAFLATIFSLGLALISKNIRSLWKQARTGDEIKQRKIVDDIENKKFSTDTKADGIRKGVLNQDNSEKLIDKKSFEHFFCKYKSNDKEKGVGVCSLKSGQVTDCLNRGLFDKDTAKFITIEQIKEIDFTQVDCTKAGGEEVINAMMGGKNIQSLANVDSLYQILPFVHSNVLDNLTEEQRNLIDFENEKITKNIFDKFSIKFVNNLKPEQVIVSLNRGLFCQTARYISIDQLKQIDFTQVDCLKAGVVQVINEIWGYDTKKIKAITNVDRLHHLLPFIKSFYLRYLSDEQIKSINFKDENLVNKELFDGLSGKDIHVKSNKGCGIRSLTPEQVIHCLSRNLFDETTVKFITDQMISEIEQEELEKLESTPIVEAIFARKIML